MWGKDRVVLSRYSFFFFFRGNLRRVFKGKMVIIWGSESSFFLFYRVLSILL